MGFPLWSVVDICSFIARLRSESWWAEQWKKESMSGFVILRMSFCSSTAIRCEPAEELSGEAYGLKKFDVELGGVDLVEALPWECEVIDDGAMLRFLVVGSRARLRPGRAGMPLTLLHLWQVASCMFCEPEGVTKCFCRHEKIRAFFWRCRQVRTSSATVNRSKISVHMFCAAINTFTVAAESRERDDISC